MVATVEGALWLSSVQKIQGFTSDLPANAANADI